METRLPTEQEIVGSIPTTGEDNFLKFFFSRLRLCVTPYAFLPVCVRPL